jgi:glycine/D-amino acid oxidase-like deaminating enzyme
MVERADVVVVGAGIAGVSTAYRLAVGHGVGRVVVVDPRPPLSLTSDKSTECYRNWWPTASMVGLMNRSIDLIEEISEASGDSIGLSRRGYLFVTADKDRLRAMSDQAALTSSYGAGAVRAHPGEVPYGDAFDGVDILSPGELATHFPYLTRKAVGAVHIRRAGWFSAQQLGAWMLDRVREHGGRLVTDTVTAVDLGHDRVSGVRLASGDQISAPAVVSAAGPLSGDVGRMAGVDLPLFSELHLKVAFRDHLGVIPREAPMIIWSDPQWINWSDEEREGLAAEGRHDLLGEMPVFCHGRPEGGSDSPYFLALWEYHREVLEPVWPIAVDPLYPEVVMRGLATMVPGLAAYLDRLPEAAVDGGYYTKTADNRPIVGPAGPAGFYVVAGLSGFGVMVSPGVADLVARHVTGVTLPHYAEGFTLDRFARSEYLEQVQTEDSGQL